MKYRKLGAAGVKVSELCLGAMTFGEADDKSFMHKVSSDEKTSFAIMNRALELGVNFIDTADVYGQDGLSERVIGAWFERDAQPRAPPGRRVRRMGWRRSARARGVGGDVVRFRASVDGDHRE